MRTTRKGIRSRTRSEEANGEKERKGENKRKE
jgi:hypothetical protein